MKNADKSKELEQCDFVKLLLMISVILYHRIVF